MRALLSFATGVGDRPAFTAPGVKVCAAVPAARVTLGVLGGCFGARVEPPLPLPPRTWPEATDR